MKFNFQIMFASALLGVASVTAVVANVTDPVPVTDKKAETAAWTSKPHGAAMVEMLSRDPKQSIFHGTAEMRLPSMPVKGMSLGLPADDPTDLIFKAPRRVIPGGTNIGGFLWYNELNYDPGFYTIPITQSTQLQALKVFEDLDINGLHGGAVSSRFAVFSFNNSYIQNGYYSGFTAIVDRETWEVLGCAGDYAQTYRWATDMTYDPSTNRFYGCFLNEDETAYNLGFMQVDDANPGRTVNSIHVVAELQIPLAGIAADANGTLWGITFAGQLVTVNRKTAELTLVANTGMKTNYNGSLSWDMNREILYWSICYGPEDNVKSALCTIDPQSGELSYVNNFGGATAQFAALFADFAAKDAAPAAPANLKVDIEGFDYTGNVVFDAPTALENGYAATGSLQAQLTVTNLANYSKAIETTVDIEYGQTGVTIPVELTLAGNYSFAVRAINDEGPSYPATDVKYVGIDHPQSVQGIVLTCENGVFTATWDPVTAPVNGGYFNPDELTYRVTVSMCDDRGNAQNLIDTTTAENSVSENVEDTTDLRAFRISVTPVCSGVAGETTSKDWQWFGYLSAPVFDPMTTPGGWTTKCLGGNSWYHTSDGWAIPYEWGNYNTSWLFSPAVMLEKGEVYTISFKAFSDVVYHTGALRIGRAPQPESMGTQLTSLAIAPRSTQTVSTFYVCPETGIYYFGILNNTASDTWTNYPNVVVNNFSVTAVDHGAPAAADLEVTRNPSGSLEVPVKVTVPSVTLGGETLEGPLRLLLKRDSKVLISRDDVNPGEIVECTDTVYRGADYTYSAVVSNEIGSGAPSVVNLFIGAGQPKEVGSVTDREDAECEVTVEWTPVTRNIYNLPLDEEAVSYNVINVLQNAYVERYVKGNSYQYQACEPGTQLGVLYSVNAETEDGVSSTYGTYSTTGLHFVGTPANLPIRDTFATGRKLAVPWIVVNQSSGYDGFTICNMMTEEGMPDANGDGNALMGFVPFANSTCGLYSGTIDVPEDVNAPALRYAVLNINFGSQDNDNLNLIRVYIIGDKDGGLVDQFALNELPLGWNYRNIDLGLLKGQKVHIMIEVMTRAYTTYYFDDINLFDRADTDIEISGMTIPASAKPGEKFDVYVEAFNKGLSAIPKNAHSKIEIYRDGKYIGSKKMTELKSLQSKTIQFSDHVNLVDAPSVNYKAVLNFEDDGDASNNEMSADVRVILPNFPAPEDLSIDRNNDGYPELTWTGVDLEPVFKPTTAYFESFQGYSLQHLEGFSTIDVDGNAKALGNFPVPHGWELFYSPSLSHSGNCFLMSSACQNGAPKEDWLVSPKLSGRAQTIGFYIATDWDAHENFYVYTSTTGNELEDFGTEPIYTGRTLSNNWEKIMLDLPEGTQYFAIVAKADDTTDLMVLMVDDVTYEGVPQFSELEFAGYKAYRDRECIVSEGLMETGFTDTDASIGGHYYRVTALYANGEIESAPTEEVYVFSRGGAPDLPGSGIDEVDSLQARITVLKGAVKFDVEGNAKVELFDYSGRQIFSGLVAGSKTVPVQPGTYIVTVEGKPLRILVK